MSKGERGFRPDIEGLRGIAVLTVVAFHCGIQGFPGGFTGVDVFFVLSGYLITGLLAAEVARTSRISLLDFYARRLRRLLPASALTLLVTLLAGAWILAPNELSFAARAARATAVYMSNVFFGANAADYFAADVETNPMLHTWSLAVEEQFYMFWPLLIMAGLQWLRSRRALVWILAVMTALSLAVSIWSTAQGGTFAFYQLPARAWEFGVGGLAALPAKRSLRLPDSGWLAVGWIGLAAVFGSSLAIPGGANFPGWVALIPVLGTAATLMAGAELPGRGPGVLLRSLPLQWLGKLSYSWYLWHWPFLVFGAALIPGVTPAGKALLSLAALLTALVAHRLVENPIRFHPALVGHPGRTLVLGLGLTALSLGIASAALRFAAQLSRAPEMERVMTAVDDISRLPRTQCVTMFDSPEIKPCPFGDTSAATHVVLFGDSHAIQWFNPLETISRQKGWRLTVIVKSGCPSFDIPPPGTSHAFQRACAEWRTAAFRHIHSLQPSAVVLGNATTYLGREHDTFRDRVTPGEWRRGVEHSLRQLPAKSRLILMRDNPLPLEDVPTCLARSLRRSSTPAGACDFSKALSLNSAAFSAESAAAAPLVNVSSVDLTDQLCQGETCWATRDREVVYRDNNHLTGRFAESLAPALAARLSVVR